MKTYLVIMVDAVSEEEIENLKSYLDSVGCKNKYLKSSKTFLAILSDTESEKVLHMPGVQNLVINKEVLTNEPLISEYFD